MSCFCSPLYLQQQVINVARTIGIPQIQVVAGQPSVQVVSAEKEAEVTTPASDQPRILYQCGDCEELFKTLQLWQQHRKEEACQQAALVAKTNQETQPDLETIAAQCSSSLLNPEDDSLSKSESNQNLNSDLVENILEKEMEHVADTSLSQTSEPPDSEVAASNSNAEDSSPKKRGASKKPKPEPVLLCVDCGSCFGLVSELVAHRKTQHGFEEALHRCSVCGECFLNTTLFLYHRKQHRQKGEENVVVPQERSDEVCSQSIASPSIGGVTSSIMQPAMFMCTDCGQSFNDGGALVTHRKQKHDLLEPLHSCHCGETFMNTTQYLYHRRQHGSTSGQEMADEAETGDEEAISNPQAIPQSSKRLLSPSANESDSPIPKRGRPSFRILSGNNSLKGK